MIQTESLQFSYSKEQSFSFPDIALSKGADLLVLGASGIGKTTLLHLMAGLLRPSSGSIVINTSDITSFNNRQLDRFRGKHIGIVFQRPHFIGALNLEEQLLLVQHLSGKKDKKAVKELLKSLGIDDKGKQHMQKLSEGQKQRASIALALINKPSLILADEPTASLDDHNCEKVINLLKAQTKLAEANLIVITHDQRLKQHFSNTISL